MSVNPTKTASGKSRSIAILFLTLIAFSAIAFIQGATKIKLGLDLRGGTSVTLTPRATQNGKVTAAAIDQAVGIIRQRVNSLGVAESEVTSQGTGVNRQIVISVPGQTGQRIVQLVGQTAELRFRQVLAEGNATAKSAAADTKTATLPTGVSQDLNTKYANLDCSNVKNLRGGSTDSPSDTIVSCNRSGSTKYILGPAQVLGSMISKASAAIDQQGSSGWYVLLNFNGEGTKKFGEVTSAITNLTAPQNQLAIVLDGLVVSAPRIIQAITAGNAQITGNF